MELDAYESYGTPLSLIYNACCIKKKSHKVTWKDVGPNSFLSFLANSQAPCGPLGTMAKTWSDHLAQIPIKMEVWGEQDPQIQSHKLCMDL